MLTECSFPSGYCLASPPAEEAFNSIPVYSLDSVAERALIMTSSSDDVALSPHERNETITHPLAIFRVTAKISAQDLLLVEEPPDEDGKTQNGEQSPPPCSQCEWDCDEQPDSAGIHGVAHIRIGAGIYHLLTFLYSDVGCRVGIELDNPKDEEK